MGYFYSLNGVDTVINDDGSITISTADNELTLPTVAAYTLLQIFHAPHVVQLLDARAADRARTDYATVITSWRPGGEHHELGAEPGQRHQLTQPAQQEEHRIRPEDVSGPRTAPPTITDEDDLPF